jgi:hypothetical protein
MRTIGGVSAEYGISGFAAHAPKRTHDVIVANRALIWRHASKAAAT